MLASSVDIIRLSLHVLAAAVWVGGQITLAGLVPTIRQEAPAAVPPIARQFARLSWPAYIVLLLTGVWNVLAVGPSTQSPAWRAVLSAKIAVALISGLSAGLHQRSATARGRAIWGAMASLSALSALVLGVALAG
jgi:putative copper export protein